MVAQPEYALAVSYDRDADVRRRPVLNERRNPPRVGDRDVQPRRPRRQRAKPQTRVADGGGVQDRQKLLRLLLQERVERRLVRALKRHELTIFRHRVVAARVERGDGASNLDLRRRRRGGEEAVERARRPVRGREAVVHARVVQSGVPHRARARRGGRRGRDACGGGGGRRRRRRERGHLGRRRRDGRPRGRRRRGGGGGDARGGEREHRATRRAERGGGVGGGGVVFVLRVLRDRRRARGGGGGGGGRGDATTTRMPTSRRRGATAGRRRGGVRPDAARDAASGRDGTRRRRRHRRSIATRRAEESGASVARQRGAPRAWGDPKFIRSATRRHWTTNRTRWVGVHKHSAWQKRKKRSIYWYSSWCFTCMFL